MVPPIMKHSPPIILRSVIARLLDKAARIRSASFSSYAMQNFSPKNTSPGRALCAVGRFGRAVPNGTGNGDLRDDVPAAVGEEAGAAIERLARIIDDGVAVILHALL